MESISNRILIHRDEVNGFRLELHINLLDDFNSAQLHLSKILPDIKISTLIDIGVYEIQSVSIFEYHIKKGKLFEWLDIFKVIINHLNEEIEKGTQIKVNINSL